MSKLEAKIILSGVDKASRPLQNTSKSAKLLAGQIKETKIKLSELNKLETNMDGFTKLKQNLKTTSQSFRDAQDKVKQLSEQLSKTENPTKKLTNQFTQAKKSADKLKDSFFSQAKELRKQHAELLKSGISTKNLAQHQSTLKTKIEQTSQSLNKQNAQLAKINQHMQKQQAIRASYDKGMQRIAIMGGVGYGSLATGRTMTYGMRNLLGVGYEFDASMSQTQAVTRIDDKNDPRMLALREQARTLPLQSKFTDSQVAAGQYFLGRTGYDANQILSAMPHMLNLATAGDMDLAQTADIASNIQKAMRIPAEQMDKVSDILTAAFTRNNVDIPMLGESLKYTAGITRQYGQSLETITAATALLGNAGVQGSQAGTSLRQVLIRIGGSSAVKKLGIKTADKDGNMRDLGDIFEDIQKATAHMGNIQRGDIYKQIAGQIGVTGFNELMATVETGEFQQMRNNLYNSKGEAEKVAKTMIDNLKGDMTFLHAAFENISVELFEKNNDWLRKTVQGLTHFLHGVSEFLKRHPAISKAIVMLGSGLAVLTTAFGGLALVLMSVFGPMLMTKFILSRVGLSIGGLAIKNGLLGKSFGFLGSSILNVTTLPLTALSTSLKSVGSIFTWLGNLVRLNPIGIAITLIAGAALLIYKYWEPIKAFFQGVWEGFSNAIEPVKIALEPLEPLFNLIAKGIRSVCGVISILANWFGDLLEPVKFTSEELDGARSAGLAFGEALAWAIQLPIKGITWLLDKLKELTKFFTTIPEKLAELPSKIGELFTGEGGITGIFSNLGNNLVDGLTSGIKEKISSVKNVISELSDGVTGWFKDALGIHSPSRVFAQYGGFTVEGFQLGIERNSNKALRTMSEFSDQISEKGLSNVTIDNRPPITSSIQNNQTPSVSSPQIYITINAAPNANPQDLAQMVGQEVSKHLRTQQNNYRNSYRDID